MHIRKIPATGEVVQPLTTDEAKLFLRVDGADDDAFIDELVSAAAQTVADQSWSSVTYDTWELVLPGFPGSSLYRDPAIAAELYRLTGISPRGYARRRGDTIRLPRGPVRSVARIAYVDPSGASIELDQTLYQRSLTDGDALLAPAPGEAWPGTETGNLEAVVVEYIAGYDGDGYRFLPQAKQACRMLVAHWYENRETVLVGAMSKEIELGLSALCASFDQRRFNPGR